MAQEEGYLGRKTDEPSISSSEATGSNKLIIMPDPAFFLVRLQAKVRSCSMSGAVLSFCNEKPSHLGYSAKFV